MNQTCYLCNSTSNKEVFNENGIPILKCLNCGHIFSSYEQEEHYDGYWDGESSEEYDLDWWDLAHRDIYDEFIQNFMVSETGSILDVGCGLGFFVKKVTETKPNWSVLGYEMSTQAVEFARNQNQLKSVYSGMVQSSGIGKNSIDVITLWDVIEHIPKPQPLLEYLYSILKPGGILFIQTPNVPIQLLKAKLKVFIKGMKPEVHYLEAKDHINDYSMQSLSRLAKNIGFTYPEYHILKPILSVAGSKGSFGVYVKIAYYFLTKFIWILSFKKLNFNNTLFAICKK